MGRNMIGGQRHEHGFVAGTLVHTGTGLVPIERVRAGDRVLSPVDASGLHAYRQVLDTFRFEPRQVHLIRFYTAQAHAAAKLAGATIPREDFHAVVVTGDQLFRVTRLGWTRAADLEHHNEFVLADGRAAFVSSVDKVYRTVTDDVGWVQGRGGRDDEEGRLLDLRGGRILYGARRVFNKGVDWWEGDQWLQMPVHQLEVEDSPCWYAGALGVCVRAEEMTGTKQ